MSLKTDKIQLEVIIKGDKSRAELVQLETESKKLSRELRKLPKDSDEFIKKSAEFKKVQQRMDQLRNEIGLTGMTMRELRNRSKELSIALNNIDPRTEQYAKLRAEYGKVSARMNELRTGASQTGISFQKMAVVAASITGVAYSIKSVVNAYAEAEKAQKKVEQAVKQTGGAAGFSAKELGKMAEELKNATTFDDDQILNDVTAQMLTFTNVSGQNFKLAQEAALDLSTVLDGDLKSASIQLGKALNDPMTGLTALRRSGVIFTEDQREQIKVLTQTGRLQEAQAIILQEVNRQYGGQAEAAAKGAGGLEQLNVMWGDIKENIGGFIVKEGAGVIVWFKNAFTWIKENTSVIISLVKIVGSLVAGWVAFKVVNGIIKGFNAIMVTSRGVMGLFKTSTETTTKAAQTFGQKLSKVNIGGLIGIITTAVTLFMTLRDAMNKTSLSQEIFNDLQKRSIELSVDEKNKVDSLFKAIINTKEGTDARKTAIDNLNFAYSSYLPNLLTEKSSLTDLIGAYEEINKQIDMKVKLQAISEKSVEVQKQIMEVREALDKAEDAEKNRTIAGDFFHADEIDVINLNNQLNELTNTYDALMAKSAVLQSSVKKEKTGYQGLSQQIAELEALYRDQLLVNDKGAAATKAKIDELKKVRDAVDDAADANDGYGKSTKELSGKVQELNDEISKYENLLQEQVYNKDERAAATAEKLQDLKDEKKLYEDLIKSILDAAAVKKLLDEYQVGDPEKLKPLTPDTVGIDDKPDIIGNDVLAQHSSETEQLTEKEKAGLDKKAELQTQYQMMLAENLMNIANQAQDVIEAYAERRINRQYNKELEALKAKYAAGKMSEDQYNAAVVASEERKSAALAKVKRKVAVFEKGVAITQIGIDTFKKVAEIKAMAALLTANPATLAYAPVALAQIPLVIASSAVQAALIAAKPINEYAEGRYPVTGRSGKKYNADFVGKPSTGIYSKPSLGIFSEQRPELIVDYPTLRNLQMRSPEVINEIYRAAGKIPEFAEGKYPNKIASSSSAGSDPVVSMKLDIVIQLLSSINANGQNAQTYKDLYERLDEEGKRKNFISGKFTG